MLGGGWPRCALVWVDGYGTGNVEGIDPEQMKVVARIPIGPSLWDVEFAENSIWATSEFNGTVSRIDPATNAATAAIKVGSAPRQVRYGAGAIWVGSHSGTSIYRVDPLTNRARAIAPDGSVFVPNNGDGTVRRIDPARNRVVGTLKVGPRPFPAAAAFGDVWVPVSGAKSVVRIHVG